MSIHMDGQGPAVVLLHSSMSSKNQWNPLVQVLRPQYRIIAMDLLGYGDSPMRRRDTNYRLADETCFVEGLLARTLPSGEPYHLVGHSYGAVVGMSLAQRSPQRIASLTLFEPMAAHLLPPSDPARLEFERLGGEVRQRVEAGDAAGAAARFIDFWSGDGTFAGLPEFRQRAFTALVPKVLMEFHAIALERRVTSWLRGFQAPVCLMTGSLSPAAGHRVVASLADLLPRASHLEVQAGHMAPVTHPELVNPEIRRFIADVEEARVRADVAAHEIPADGHRPARFPARAVAVGLAGLLCVSPPSQGVAAGNRDAASVAGQEAGARHREAAVPLRGARYEVVSGDPYAAGHFVLHVTLPPGFESVPRFATNELQLVVLSGDLTVGRGPMARPLAIRRLTSGYFALLSAHQTYFASSEHGATVQVFGTGPIND